MNWLDLYVKSIRWKPPNRLFSSAIKRSLAVPGLEGVQTNLLYPVRLFRGTPPVSKTGGVEDELRDYYMADLRITRDPKDLRIRKQLFPNGESLVFDTAKKGFIPLPILLRKAIRHLSSPELRALIYLSLRASRFGICYPTQEEIAYEVGLEGTKNLQPVLKSLERMRFITTRMSMGKKFYLVHDPLVGIQKLLNDGKIDKEELIDINNLCEDLGRPPLFRQPAEPTVPA